MHEIGKIVIFYAWGTLNAGDHALTMGALKLLSSLVNQDQLVIASRFARAESKYDPSEDIKKLFPSVRVIPSPFGFSRNTWLERLIQNLHGLALVLTCLCFPKLSLKLFCSKESIQEIGNARIVLLNGGNLFFWHKYRKSIPRLVALAFPLLMARRLGIPYGMLPQTSGPFEGWVGRLLAKLYENANFVLFRDGKSLKHVKKIADLSKTKATIVPDLAFFLNDGKKAQQDSSLREIDLKKNEFIAVTVRATSLGDPGIARKLDNYSKTLSSLEVFLPKLLANVEKNLGKKTIIVIQSDDDIDASMRIRKKLRDEYGIHASVINLRNPIILSELYSNALLLIGMRLHSMIFALSQGTPVIGLWRKELGFKIPAMFSDMRLEEYVFELGSADPYAVMDAVANLARQRNKITKQIGCYLKRRTTFEKDFLRSHGLTYKN